MIDARAVEQMKVGVMLINTSREGLLDARAAIAGLKSGESVLSVDQVVR